MNGISKLLLNKHLPAMRKASGDIGGLGIISDVQLLREMGIAEIQAMGDLVSTRYANPNFARGGLRAGARGTISGKIPKQVRSVFNMQVFMQATLLTTLTEMQRLWLCVTSNVICPGALSLLIRTKVRNSRVEGYDYSSSLNKIWQTLV